ncbi:ATPase [Sporosarcina sp. GW1-11]|uniref:ATPase n=1 Tax=Sporosarcina sp. GW1-11 TaxID=2899126 RepID=UPI00294CB262|nr:ATPase [Sporosarcina sp. GW1-11]MDV6377883.1 ATPase [Sporosarcina sp. GW1-11]
MDKTFWIPLLVSFGTIILLYLLGYVADVDVLIFRMSLSETEISLVPIAGGLLAGFITERMIKSKAT